jgi:SAM-dependent methyltransferase
MWHAIGRQLGHPRGWPGRTLGRLMRVANRGPNRLALDALSLAPGDSVLELGFGPGEALAAMARSGCRSIHGIDRSAAMLRQAARRNRAAVAAGHIQLRQGDFASLPYPDASFDKVLAVNVVYFWHDATAVIGEIRRVLRPGGTLVLYATDAGSMRQWKFAGAKTHRQFDGTALASLLIGGGFAPGLIAVTAAALAGGVTGLVALAKTSIPANEADRMDPPRGIQLG